MFFVVYIIVFFIIEKHTPTEGYWLTDIPFDSKIPFIPQFVWAYILWYPLFAAVGIPLLVKDGDAFKRWMYYMMSVLTVTLLFDVLFPNGQGQRPQGVEVTGASTWMLSLIWGADTPTNVFPSMHVLGCIGDVLGVCDSAIFSRGYRALIIVLSVLCAASTVFVKQHAVVDTVGALVFALPAFLIFYRRRFLIKKSETLE